MERGISKKNAPGEIISKYLQDIGRKRGKARAKKYDIKTFRKWAKQSGPGRPRKSGREDQ